MGVSDASEMIIKCLALPAAIIGTIQAVAWLGLALLSILYYNDAIAVENSLTSINQILYSIYLNPYQKDDPILYSQYYEKLWINAENFNIFMYLYLVLSFIWLASSIVLMWVVLREKEKHFPKSVINWTAITLLTAVLDILLMSGLARDYNKAHEILEQTSGLFNIQDVYTSIGIVMTLAARGYILWLLNVILAVIFIGTLIKSRNSILPSMQRPIINGYGNGTSQPFTIYDQIEIDKAFENEGFKFDEPNIFSPRTNELFNNNNNNNRNPLSNSNRSSLTYAQSTPEPFELSRPKNINSSLLHGKLAKIGKPGGRRSPPRNVPSPIVPHGMPYIPEPDYTPPASPKLQPKSVLRPRSNYEY